MGSGHKNRKHAELPVSGMQGGRLNKTWRWQTDVMDGILRQCDGHGLVSGRMPGSAIGRLYQDRPKMKAFLLFAVLIGLAAGCFSSSAPAMKRLAKDDPIDERYLKDVFVPAYSGPHSKSELSNSVSQLQGHLAEFRVFMHDVEDGKIRVTQGMKGNWHSSVMKDGAWIAAYYSDRLGPVIDFQKHTDRDPFPMIYSFILSSDGHIKWATTMHDGFEFDAQGRVKQYWHEETERPAPAER